MTENARTTIGQICPDSNGHSGCGSYFQVDVDLTAEHAETTCPHCRYQFSVHPFAAVKVCVQETLVIERMVTVHIPMKDYEPGHNYSDEADAMTKQSHMRCYPLPNGWEATHTEGVDFHYQSATPVENLPMNEQAYHCPKCDSTEVIADGPSSYSIDFQQWESDGFYDEKTCNSCGAVFKEPITHHYSSEEQVMRERYTESVPSDAPRHYADRYSAYVQAEQVHALLDYYEWLEASNVSE